MMWIASSSVPATAMAIPSSTKRRAAVIAFEARRDVDAVAEEVVFVDQDVAEIDAYAKFNAPLATVELEPRTPCRPRCLTMAAPGHVFTISRAAKILRENEELLWDLANEMEPEDGCLWIYGTSDQQTIAFTDHRMKYLQELLAEQKRNRSLPRS
jgi:hypothetical protein